MTRRDVLCSLAWLLCPVALPLCAEPPKTMPVVGVPLIAAGPTDMVMEELRRGLREHGYVEGQNIRIEYRSAEGKVERLPALLQELLRTNVDVIVAGAEPIVKAATEATRTVPIVLVGWGYDPVVAGFVESLNRPGRNVTGVYLRGEDTHAKRLELLKELVPGLSRIAVLYDAIAERQLARLLTAAKALGLAVQPIKLSDRYDFESAFKRAKADRVGAAAVLSSPGFYVNRDRIAAAALTQRLPTAYHDTSFAHAGGLIAYGPSTAMGWRRAAYFVDRILKGARPAELPVEQADVYTLVVNARTAKALGVTVPESILLRADEVIR